jgi:hypothetical protein
LASNSREFVAVEDAPVVRTAEPHLNQPTAGSHVAAAGFISHRRQLAGRRTCVAAEVGTRRCSSSLSLRPTSMQFGYGVARLDDSEGVHLNQIGGV